MLTPLSAYILPPNSKRTLIIGFCIILLTSAFDIHATSSIDPLEECLINLEDELNDIEYRYELILNSLNENIRSIENSLSSSKNIKDKLSLFIEKDRWIDSVQLYKQKRKRDVNKVRYLKGIEIIKILYEKSLSLDHHYSAMASIHNFEQIANPNNYNEFSVAKEKLAQKTERKSGFNLGAILGNNIYTSIIHSMLSLFGNESLGKPKKDEIIDNIECILDFTLQMNNDLKTVYFESMYLQSNCEEAIRDIEKLFSFYVKPINYTASLRDCRNGDDWLSINKKVTAFIKRHEFLSNSKISWDEAEEMLFDLEFSINRLLQLIYNYNLFINQSSKFYEKFAFMLDNYKNEEHCVKSIPVDFIELKESINTTIKKFHNTYQPVELNGSKMKQLLYGVGY